MKDELSLQLLTRILALEQKFERLAAQVPNYQIFNIKPTRDFLSSSTAAYNPGAYDMALVYPTTSLTIRGITGGVPGRVLWIRNSNPFTLSFTHVDALAANGDEIVTVSGATVDLVYKEVAIFMYVPNSITLAGRDRWFMLYPNS